MATFNRDSNTIGMNKINYGLVNMDVIKSPGPCVVYTTQQLEEFAKERGISVSPKAYDKGVG